MSGTRGLLLQVPPTLDAACLPGRVLLTLLGTPALADNNDWPGQAQRFFNNNQSSDRDAYERGREDEMRPSRQSRIGIGTAAIPLRDQPATPSSTARHALASRSMVKGFGNKLTPASSSP